MARLTADGDEQFAFSTDTRANLETILREDCSLIQTLERVIRASIESRTTPPQHGQGVELRRTVTALRRLVSAVDGLSEASKESLKNLRVMTMGELMGKPGILGLLPALRNEAGRCLVYLDPPRGDCENTSVYLRDRRRRGRPYDVVQRHMAAVVAIVLKYKGITLRKSRSGKLACVLREVLLCLRGKAPEPEHMFRVIKATCDYVNGLNRRELVMAIDRIFNGDMLVVSNSTPGARQVRR
jgi:hypothetical protein